MKEIVMLREEITHTLKPRYHLDSLWESSLRIRSTKAEHATLKKGDCYPAPILTEGVNRTNLRIQRSLKDGRTIDLSINLRLSISGI